VFGTSDEQLNTIRDSDGWFESLGI